MDAIKRLVIRCFPELAGKYHLPHFAIVVKTPESRSTPALCDESKPEYSVDVQLLDENLNPDLNFPIFTSMPVPISSAGNNSGMLGLPLEGSMVEIAFAYGSPAHPFIRTVLPHGVVVPKLDKGEKAWYHSNSVYQRADGAGNWHRTTNKTVFDNSNDTIERIENIRDSIAKQKQLIKVDAGGKIYLGDDSENILQMLSDLMDSVDKLAQACAIHQHPALFAAPVNPVPFIAESSASSSLKSSLDPMVE